MSGRPGRFAPVPVAKQRHTEWEHDEEVNAMMTKMMANNLASREAGMRELGLRNFDTELDRRHEAQLPAVVVRAQTAAERRAKVEDRLREEQRDLLHYQIEAVHEAKAEREGERMRFRGRPGSRAVKEGSGPTLGYRLMRRFVRPFMSDRRWMDYLGRHFEGRS